MDIDTTSNPIKVPSNPKLPVTRTININAKYKRETKNDLDAIDILPDSSASSNTSIFHTVVAYHTLSIKAVRVTSIFS